MWEFTRRMHITGKRALLGFGAIFGVAALIIGGWLVWSVLKPPPDGFAPTVGEARGVSEDDEGIRQYTIDATSRQEWVRFSFSQAAEVQAPPESLDWDIAFRRTDVTTNGGETNPAGSGGATELGMISLPEAEAPADGFLPDMIDEERGLENPALHSWYSYDWMTHVVSSDGHTYGVMTATGETALITFLSYYCEDGSAGCVTFQYRYPPPSDGRG